MTWTTEKPTAAGWYWMRAPKCGWRDCVVWVDKDEDGFYIDVGDCDSEYVMDIEAEWLGPITPDSYQHGRAAVNVDALVDRFLAWPLPASVCSDLCATKQGYPHRSGTNLLSAVEAKAMLEYVLGIAQQAQEAT